MSNLQSFSETINVSPVPTKASDISGNPIPGGTSTSLRRFSETISIPTNSELSEEEFEETEFQESEAKLLGEFKKNFVDSIEMRKSVSERKKAQSNLEKLFKNPRLPEKIRGVIPDVRKTFELITAKAGEEGANFPAVQATGRVITKMGWKAPLYEPETDLMDWVQPTRATMNFWNSAIKEYQDKTKLTGLAKQKFDQMSPERKKAYVWDRNEAVEHDVHAIFGQLDTKTEKQLKEWEKMGGPLPGEINNIKKPGYKEILNKIIKKSDTDFLSW